MCIDLDLDPYLKGQAQNPTSLVSMVSPKFKWSSVSIKYLYISSLVMIQMFQGEEKDLQSFH